LGGGGLPPELREAFGRAHWNAGLPVNGANFGRWLMAHARGRDGGRLHWNLSPRVVGGVSISLKETI